MNYVYLLMEIIIIFVLMILFYKFGKKEGLFLYISLMATLINLFMFKSIDIFSFEIDLGIPFVMGIFTCSNVIIQRYGIDEVKDIIKSFIVPYVITMFILSLITLTGGSEYNIITNDSYNNLFSYSIDNIRINIGYLISISFAIWCNSYIYYYIRVNKNKYLFSNVGALLVVQFIESIVFILITYLGNIDITVIFGMLMVRYLFKVVLGVIGLLPFGFILKMKS